MTIICNNSLDSCAPRRKKKQSEQRPNAFSGKINNISTLSLMWTQCFFNEEKSNMIYLRCLSSRPEVKKQVDLFDVRIDFITSFARETPVIITIIIRTRGRPRSSLLHYKLLRTL